MTAALLTHCEGDASLWTMGTRISAVDLDPAAPLNQGSFRPIEVNAPIGTIINVQRPAPAGSHGEIRKRVIATMVGACSDR